MVTWVKHVACMGEKRDLSSVLENLKESDHLEDLCTDKRIILQWILTRMGGCQLDSSGTA
jgi:hypothetical protein